MEYEGFDVYWDGHGSVRVVDGDFTVAVDPFSEVSPDFDANLVLITHEDAGHFDDKILDKICNDRTCVVIPDSISKDEVPCKDVEYIGEGEVIDVFGIEIEAVPMYNDFHERGEGLGYRFVMRDESFYIAGDTGVFEEAFELEKRVDIAFLPVEGKFTMDTGEAVRLAVRIKPEITVPYHFGEPFFSDQDIDLRGFKAELQDRNLECKTLEAETDH